MDTIFVSIPSYRDPECIHTVKDLFAKADNTERIFVGICLQVALEDDIKIEPTPHVRVAVIDYKDARGPSHARHLIQQLYDNEVYYLQIDSHTRMAEKWDTALIAELHQCEGEKPILTTYPASYEVADPYDPHIDSAQLGPQVTIVLKPKDFSSKGDLRLRGCVVEAPDRPISSAFWAAGFSFSSGSMVTEVPYPPNWEDVFFGEEEAMGAMLWTRGWNFFSPTTSYCYHLWSRRIRHTFWELNRPTSSPVWKHKVGDVRTMEAYSKLAGVDFDNKIIYGSAEVSALPMLAGLGSGISANIEAFMGQAMPTHSVTHEGLPCKGCALLTEDEVRCFNKSGFVIVTEWASRLGDVELSAVRVDLSKLELRPASVGQKEYHNNSIRGDSMAWISGTEGQLGIVEKSLKELVAHWDSQGFGSSDVSIMTALYPGDGSGYIRHLDTRIGDEKKRRITACFFPNVGVRGGSLRVYNGDTYHDIAAENGNLVVFSSPSIEHEVLPTFDPRWAITMWVY